MSVGAAVVVLTKPVELVLKVWGMLPGAIGAGARAMADEVALIANTIGWIHEGIGESSRTLLGWRY